MVHNKANRTSKQMLQSNGEGVLEVDLVCVSGFSWFSGVLIFAPQHASFANNDEAMFGQVVLGPPGAGKTTYCHGMMQFLTGIGRKVAIVNLDPANESLPYPCALDVKELVSMKRIMEEMELGPNGGLIYCMEYLETNFDWLENALRRVSGL